MTTYHAAIPFPEIDPVAIAIGPLAIRWYALAYIAGILLGWLYMARLVRNPRLWGREAPVTARDVDDIVVWAALGIILGGRIGYVAFYNPAYFAAHPLEIFALWQGGMAFHGGLVGVILAVVIFARVRSLPLLSLGDLVAIATPFGLFFGRLANFINGELFGRPSDVPWAMVFPAGGPLPRHPSQLYEAALEGLLLFAILAVATHRLGALKRPGLVTGLFITLYGLFRIVAELFRMPDAHIGYFTGGLTMGMLLSAPMIPIGLAFVWVATRRREAAAP